MRRPGDFVLQVEEAGGPLVLLTGPDARKHIDLGAALCARYSDPKHQPEVVVGISNGTWRSAIRKSPAGEDIIERYRIQ